MLSNTGTCSYNGVSFTAGYKSRVSAVPHQDEAGRTTTDVEHTIEVDGYVSAQTTDATLSSMRQALTAQGGALVFTGKGYGDLTVNSGSQGVRDVAWGPTPKLLEWIPIGNENAAKVKWRVTTRIPECSNAVYQNALMAFNYEISTDIDQDGYSEVIYSGYIEIPMTRRSQGDRTPPDSADKYLEMIAPPLPTGFQRRWHRTLSKDKRRLDFTVTDRQLAASYPDGITDIDLDQTVENAQRVVFANWNISIEGTITTAAGVPKSKALEAFLQVVQSRIPSGVPNIIRTPGGRSALAGTPFIYPVKFRAGDKIFGRTSSFAMTLYGVNMQTIFSALNATGMWQPIAGTDFRKWAQSLVPYANNPRGQANLMHNPTDDIIIDLCIPRTDTIRTGTPRPPTSPGTPNPDFVPTLPPPGSSWIYNVIRLSYRERSLIATYKPLPLRPIAEPNVLRTFSPSNRAGKAVIGPGIAPAPGMQSAPADVNQRPVAPSRKLYLEGFATRFGYRAPVPSLIDYQGLAVTETDRVISEGQIGEVGGIPIWATACILEYSMNEYPDSGIPTAPTPTLTANGLSGTSPGQISTLRTSL